MSEPNPQAAPGPASTPAVPAPPAAATEVGSVFVSNYPPYSFWNVDAVAEAERVLDVAVGADQPLGLYLHLPFCRKRCKFCYFRVFVDKNAEEIQRYLDALAREVELFAARPAIAGRPLSFVYFGGGTPSYVAVKHLQVLLGRVKTALPWERVEEVTFECEPGTLTEPKVAFYREMGVTRLSLGVEHFDDRILEENGRAHLSHEIYRCLPWIKAQGFDQLNVDLIAGMVGDRWETWKTAVEKTIEVDPDSVTIYQMELPFNTVYSKSMLEAGEASPVADWPTKRAWNDWAIDRLREAGYEIASAYTMVKKAQHGTARFVYRDALWRGTDMLGTGVASFSHLQGVHFQNHAAWAGYLGPIEAGRLAIDRAFVTDRDERFTRELILQMKLGRLDLDYFRGKYRVDPLERYGEVFAELERRGMLRIAERRRVELTRSGLLQVDGLLPGFYADSYRNARYT